MECSISTVHNYTGQYVFKVSSSLFFTLIKWLYVLSGWRRFSSLCVVLFETAICFRRLIDKWISYDDLYYEEKYIQK